VLFFIHHLSRRVWVAGVTAHPTRDRAAQQARKISVAVPDDGVSIRFLIWDNDGNFGPPFDEVRQDEGAETHRHAETKPSFQPRITTIRRQEIIGGLINDYHAA
jgi:putative transposase